MNLGDKNIDIQYSGYIVIENGKYGLIDCFYEEVLPPIFDSIEYFNSIWLSGRNRIWMYLYKDGKIGTYEFCIDTDTGERENNDFYVFPNYDECIFQKHHLSIAGYFGLSYLAVREKDKWGIIDISPAKYTYYPYEDEWLCNPNLEDLEYKYDSLEDLKDDADTEFKRRHDKYYDPNVIQEGGLYNYF